MHSRLRARENTAIPRSGLRSADSRYRLADGARMKASHGELEIRHPDPQGKAIEVPLKSLVIRAFERAPGQVFFDIEIADRPRRRRARLREAAENPAGEHPDRELRREAVG